MKNAGDFFWKRSGEDRKEESNDSPEIQNMGEHQTSWPPFRGQTGQNIRHPQPPFSGQKDQTSWPPFRGQTGKNIRHPGLPSGARQGRTSDSLASFQGPDRKEHRHPGLPSEARKGRTSDILASFQKTKFLLKIVCKRLNI